MEKCGSQKVINSCMSNILASGAFLAIALALASKTRRDKRDVTRHALALALAFAFSWKTRRDLTRHTLALALALSLALALY